MQDFMKFLTKELNDIKTNNGKHYDYHNDVENLADTKITDAEFKNFIKDGLTNSREELHTASLQFLSNNRKSLINEWIKESRVEAKKIQAIGKEGVGQILINDDAKELIKKRLLAAAKQTYILYNSFLIQKILKTDSDGDKVSDLLEEKLYGTNPNSAIRTDNILIMPSGSGVLIQAAFKTDRPTSKIQIQVIITRANYMTTTYNYFYYDNGQNSLQNLQTLGISYMLPPGSVLIQVKIIFTEHQHKWETMSYGSFPHSTHTFIAQKSYMFSGGPFFP